MATVQAVLGNLTGRDRRILTAVNTGAASLSLIGSGFIVLCYLLFKELRKFSFKLVFFLALSVSNFFFFFWYFTLSLSSNSMPFCCKYLLLVYYFQWVLSVTELTMQWSGLIEGIYELMQFGIFLILSLKSINRLIINEFFFCYLCVFFFSNFPVCWWSKKNV